MDERGERDGKHFFKTEEEAAKKAKLEQIATFNKATHFYQEMNRKIRGVNRQLKEQFRSMWVSGEKVYEVTK